MADDKKSVIFDSNGWNSLLDDSGSEKVIEDLVAAYRVRISETSVFELSKTKDPERRKRLIDLCERLLPHSECLMPHQWIMEAMARLNTRYGNRFQWEEVDVRAPVVAREIVEREFIAQDALAEESRQFARTAEKDFRRIYREALDGYKCDFTDDVKVLSLAQLMAIFKADGGPFWKTVAGFYERASLVELNESDAKRFIDRCPPFHAIALATVVAHYQYAIPRGKAKAAYDAGLFDLVMSIYVPYCDLFVTDDPGSRHAMQAIVQEMGLRVDVLCYDDFKVRLNTPATI